MRGEQGPRLVEYGVGDPLYEAGLALRDAVLRQPLGLSFPLGLAETEQAYRHFALLPDPDGAPLACLMVVPHDARTLQIRQMAVAAAFQGRGHGRHLMSGVEALLRAGGFRGRVFLHARATAVPFYTRLGYEGVGEPFEEVGLVHRLMEKRIP